MSGEVHIHIASLCAEKTHAPYVVLTLTGQQEARADLPLETAREVGLWLLEAAEAAETDALAFVAFPDDHEAALNLLRLLRGARLDRRGPHGALQTEDGGATI